MLDFSWGEVMLIGGVALVVIGPKDLPKALRTLGQVTTKVRRMAAEFQHQFSEAIREAELDEVRQQVDDVRRKAASYGSGFNPVDTIRNELKTAAESRKGALSPSADPLAGTAVGAIARAQAGETERLSGGGSYDVPRPTQPDAVLSGPDLPGSELRGSDAPSSDLPGPELPAAVSPSARAEEAAPQADAQPGATSSHPAGDAA